MVSMGTSQEEDARIPGSLWPWINNRLDNYEEPQTFRLLSETLFTAYPTIHTQSKRNEKLSQFSFIVQKKINPVFI